MFTATRIKPTATRPTSCWNQYLQRGYRCGARNRGSALIVAMGIVFVTAIVASTMAMVTFYSMDLTRKRNEAIRCYYVADGVLDRVRGEVYDLFAKTGLSTPDEIANELTSMPEFQRDSLYEYQLVGDRGERGLQINEFTSLNYGKITTENHPFRDLFAWSQQFTVDATVAHAQKGRSLSQARKDRTFASAFCRETLDALAIPLVQFMAFYDQDMEIYNGPPMHIHGRVHTNGNMWLYTCDGLWFHDGFSAAGDVYRLRKEMKYYTHGMAYNPGNIWSFNGDYDASGNKEFSNFKKPRVGLTQDDIENSLTLNEILNSSHWWNDYIDVNGDPWYDWGAPYGLEWSQTPLAGEVWADSCGAIGFWDCRTTGGYGWDDFGTWASKTFNGKVKSSDHGVSPLNLPISFGTNPHEIIEPAAAGDDAQLTRAKFYNKADIFVKGVNDPSTGWTVKAYYKDGTPIPTQFVDGAGNVKKIFTIGIIPDYREDKKAVSVDMNVGNLIESGLDIGNGIIYMDNTMVGDSDPNYMPSVRLWNASSLPTTGENNGFTIATRNPLYIWGDYNTTTKNSVNSLVACDAVSVLSNSWRWDSWGDNTWERRDNPASDTTINSIIMTGQVPSIEKEFDPSDSGMGPDDYQCSGALNNLIRFHENWGGTTFNYSGGLMCMYDSEIANTKWNLGTITHPRTGRLVYTYTPPTRNWAYDTRYENPNNNPNGLDPVYTVVTVAYQHMY